MEFTEVIRDRFSCKRFSDAPVDDRALSAILEAGRLAPTAKNLQEQRIYVAKSAEALETIDDNTSCRYGAPVVLVVAYDKDNVFTYPGGQMNSGIEDATIVGTHMLLAAYNEGVDSCIVNKFDPEALAYELDLPENEEIIMLIDLGHAAEDAGPLTNHSLRKEVSEVVKYI